jgi:hypothetical protein
MRFAVFSYDPNGQQWFTDVVNAKDAVAAQEFICKLRPYVADADAWTVTDLNKLRKRVLFASAFDITNTLEKIAEESGVVICKHCGAISDADAGYAGLCVDCTDNKEKYDT